MVETTELRRSSRDPDLVRARLEAWLRTRTGDDGATCVLDVEPGTTNGLSSDTILFTGSWSGEDGPHDERLVARVAPPAHDVPVFPRYDLPRQARLITDVGTRSTVPVPGVLFVEPDAGPLGAPFFVMERVEGRVPPDVMPYTFGDNWLHDASHDEQDRLARTTVEAIAGLHAVGIDGFEYLSPGPGSESALRRHVADRQAWYEYVAADAGRSPLIDRAFAWLDANWPPIEGPAVVSWGDSRIGNVMYRDFEPVAVLDWEMAALGPRELDVGWLVYSHACFNDLAATFELPGMPDFLRPDDVAAVYEDATGHELRDLPWFGTYAAVQWAIVFVRTTTRSVHFGEREAPATVDEVIMNAGPLERMLDGSYWG